jgi:hypothetical protein
MALLTGLTEDGLEVPVQVDASGRLVAEGLAGPAGAAGAAGAPGTNGKDGAVPVQGAWHPEIAGSEDPGDANYTRQNGIYIKIGPLIYVHCLVQWTQATGTGELLITGFPPAIDQDFISVGDLFLPDYLGSSHIVAAVSWAGGIRLYELDPANNGTLPVPMFAYGRIELSGWYRAKP